MEEAEDSGGLPTSKMASGESPLLPSSASDPFKRSAKLVRSPAANSTEKRMLGPKSSSSVVTAEAEGDAFTKLGSMINNLMEYVNQRNNVHHAIKDQVRSIRASVLPR